MTDIDDLYEPGDDREPEPPEPEPYTPEEIEAALEAVTWTGTDADLSLLLEAVPQLLAQLKAAEAELEEWRGMEVRHEFLLAAPPGQVGWVTAATREQADRALMDPAYYGTPWGRSVYTTPWRPHEAAPF